jgi:hypothetical protein
MNEPLANPDRTTLIGQLSGADYAGYPGVMAALKAAGEATAAQHKAAWEALPQEEKDRRNAAYEAKRLEMVAVWEKIQKVLEGTGYQLSTTSYGDHPALTDDEHDYILDLRTGEFH